VSRSIPVSEKSFLQTSAAASQLRCADRGQFFAAIHAALDSDPQPGEGAVGRAIVKAFAAYWHPPKSAALPQPKRRVVRTARPPRWAQS
jgi:hypothetical protein